MSPDDGNSMLKHATKVIDKLFFQWWGCVDGGKGLKIVFIDSVQHVLVSVIVSLPVLSEVTYCNIQIQQTVWMISAHRPYLSLVEDIQ